MVAAFWTSLCKTRSSHPNPGVVLRVKLYVAERGLRSNFKWQKDRHLVCRRNLAEWLRDINGGESKMSKRFMVKDVDDIKDMQLTFYTEELHCS